MTPNLLNSLNRFGTLLLHVLEILAPIYLACHLILINHIKQITNTKNNDLKELNYEIHKLSIYNKLSIKLKIARCFTIFLIIIVCFLFIITYIFNFTVYYFNN